MYFPKMRYICLRDKVIPETPLHAALTEAGFQQLEQPVQLTLRGSHEGRGATTYKRESLEPFSPPESLKDVEKPRLQGRVILGISFVHSSLSDLISLGLVDISLTAEEAAARGVSELYAKVKGIHHYMDNFLLIPHPVQESELTSFSVGMSPSTSTSSTFEEFRLSEPNLYSTLEIDPDFQIEEIETWVDFAKKFEDIFLLLSARNLKFILETRDSWASNYNVEITGFKSMKTIQIYSLIGHIIKGRRAIHLHKCRQVAASTWRDLERVTFAEDEDQSVGEESASPNVQAQDSDSEERSEGDDCEASNRFRRVAQRKRKANADASSDTASNQKNNGSNKLPKMSAAASRDPSAVSPLTETDAASRDPSAVSPLTDPSAVSPLTDHDAASRDPSAVSPLTDPSAVSPLTDHDAASRDPSAVSPFTETGSSSLYLSFDGENEDSLSDIMEAFADQPSPGLQKKVLMMGMVGSMDQEPSNPSYGQWGRDNCRLKKLQEMNYSVHTIDTKHKPCTGQ
jgi:hypothetical protein